MDRRAFALLFISKLLLVVFKIPIKNAFIVLQNGEERGFIL